MPKQINDHLAHTPEEKEFLARFLGAIQDKYETDTDATKQLNIGPSQISRWRTRHYLPNAKIVMRFLRKSDVSAQWLFTGKGEKYTTQEEPLPNKARVLAAVKEVSAALNQLTTILQDIPEESEEQKLAKEFEAFQQWKQLTQKSLTPQEVFRAGVLGQPSSMDVVG